MCCCWFIFFHSFVYLWLLLLFSFSLLSTVYSSSLRCFTQRIYYYIFLLLLFFVCSLLLRESFVGWEATAKISANWRESIESKRLLSLFHGLDTHPKPTWCGFFIHSEQKSATKKHQHRLHFDILLWTGMNIYIAYIMRSIGRSKCKNKTLIHVK